jgi:hypothetical protein
MRRGLSRFQKHENKEVIRFYRAWMNRVRTKDLIQNLAELEAYARQRADWLIHYCKPHPLLSEPAAKVFQALEAQERKLVAQFAFMREKLSWVLADLNDAAGIIDSPEAKPPATPSAFPKSPPQPLPPIKSASELLAESYPGRSHSADQSLPTNEGESTS